jgi:3-dehydroquinate synthase
MSCTPSLVLCDTECLKTLPEDEYRSGLAEALKTAIVGGGEMFRMFLRGIGPENIERVIEECIKFRAQIAGDAERLRGLKLGCVVGSAIGALSGYGIQHGLATAQGIGITARASARLGWCDSDTERGILEALNTHNLPDNCVKYRASEIAQAAKKSWGKVIDMVVPVEIGRCEVKQVKAEDLEHVISLGLKAQNLV